MDTGQSKHRLLIVDGDPKSLRVLEVSLKKAGFGVTTASNGAQALAAMAGASPDLIISDTDLEGFDGFELCRQIKSKPEWTKIPFLFVSGRKSIEDKIRGLELGVDDYLTKPVYIKEIGIRVRTALQRAERERLESRRDTRTRFSGDLADIGVVDLVQTIELNRKSGIIHIVDRDGRRGAVFFRDGRVIDAEVGRLAGTEAMYRLFSWSEGRFEVEFKPIRRRDTIEVPTAALLMEGMRRLDEWTRLLETLPGLDKVVEVDYRVLADQLAELPDEVNGLLRLCDGSRSLLAAIDDSDYPDLEALTVASNLFAQHILYVREPGGHHEAEPSGELARWLEEGNALAGAASQRVQEERPTTARSLFGTRPPEPAIPGEQSANDARSFSGDSSGSSLGTPAPHRKPDEATPQSTPTSKSNTLRLPALVTTAPSAAPSGPSGDASASFEAGSDQKSTPELLANAEAGVAPGFPAAKDAKPRKSGTLTDTLRGIPVPQEQGAADWGAKSEPEAGPESETPNEAAAPSASARLRETLVGRPSSEHEIPEKRETPADGQQETDWGGWAQGTESPSQAGKESEPEPIDSFSEEAGASEPSGEPRTAPSESPDDEIPSPDRERLKATLVLSDRLQPARNRRAAPIVYSLAFLMAGGLLVWQLRSRGSEQATAAPAETSTPEKTADAARTQPAAVQPAAFTDASLVVASRPDANPARPARSAAEGSKLEGQSPADNPGVSDVLERCRKLGANSKSKANAVLTACQAANQADANATDIMVILARVELDRGNPAEARTWAKKAVEINPDLADAYVYIGGAEQEAGNSSEAKVAYKKYLELAPTGRYARELRAILDSLKVAAPQTPHVDPWD